MGLLQLPEVVQCYVDGGVALTYGKHTGLRLFEIVHLPVRRQAGGAL